MPRRGGATEHTTGRRSLLGALVLAAAALGLPGCSDSGGEDRRQPNILFVMADDHAVQAISAYGSVLNETPNIDRLAREGVLFRHCLVTNSICSPSRATILTGTYSHRNGQFTNWELFDGAQPTFPKTLQAAGYQTALIGKWHLHSDPTGFDHWEILSGLAGQGTYYDPLFKTAVGSVTYTGYTTDVITDRVLEWLSKTRDPSRPFLLMYHHKAPHRDWQPGPTHLRTFDDVTLPEPATLFDDYSGRASPARQQKMRIAEDLTDIDLKLAPPSLLPPAYLPAWNAAYGPKNDAFRQAALHGDDLVRWKYQRYVKDYLRTVASIDDNLGRVLDYLDAAGLTDETVVVYTSDQGFFLGEHGWFDKRWMYEESLHTPLLVRWPRHAPSGVVNRQLVSNLDFAATILDIAGAAVPGDMQGESFKALLLGADPTDWRESIYYHYYDYDFPPITFHDVQRHYGVRTERYKLIYYYLVDEWELFDLHQDPQELRSVYADPAYADVVADLTAELARLRDRYRVPDDPGPPAD